MESIQQDAPREIVDDFAVEIAEKRVETSAGEKARINFRDGVRRNREEKVYHVPLDLLRYRKENGRISAAVTSRFRPGLPNVSQCTDADPASIDFPARQGNRIRPPVTFTETTSQWMAPNHAFCSLRTRYS